MEQNAWKIVYDELMKVGLFRGNYDARNGGEQYMHGICTVMENIAYHVSEECADNFIKTFTTNMIDSQEVARHDGKREVGKFRL